MWNIFLCTIGWHGPKIFSGLGDHPRSQRLQKMGRKCTHCNKTWTARVHKDEDSKITTISEWTDRGY